MEGSDGIRAREDISTTSVSAARHWREVYRKLASFDHTLRRLKRQLRGFTGDPRYDAARRALPALLADAEAFGQRFDLWEARLSQLA